MAIISIKQNQENQKILSLLNPADGLALYDLECHSNEQVKKVVAKARATQSDWAALSIDERIDYMMRLRDVILADPDRIIDTVIKETGKPRQDALVMEVYSVCSFISYWCQQAKRTLKDDTLKAPGIMRLMKKVHMHYKPLGVVGIIAPWNGPFVLTANPCIQAMLAGNTVIAKGSEVTPKSSAILEELCREAGFPEGVCQVLIGDGETGAALISAGVNKISFTGSVNTGKKVAAACIENLTPYTLELGGKDAMIVCADANIDEAVHGAVWGSCINTGHYCCGVERIYVEEAIYQEFVDKSVAMVNAMRIGQEHGINEDLGAVFWDQQLKIIKHQVKDAIDRGAKLLAGGSQLEDRDGLYFQPTILSEVDEDCDLMTKETFGPVLPIIKVKGIEEAIVKANDSCYGLHGSVWTKDEKKGLAIAKRINTGAMSVNDIGLVYGIPSAPFGGVKESGIGSVNGVNGLRAYAHAMPIVVGKYRGADTGYPHDQKKYDQMVQAMNFLWKNPIGKFFFGP